MSPAPSPRPPSPSPAPGNPPPCVTKDKDKEESTTLPARDFSLQLPWALLLVCCAVGAPSTSRQNLLLFRRLGDQLRADLLQCWDAHVDSPHTATPSAAQVRMSNIVLQMAFDISLERDPRVSKALTHRSTQGLLCPYVFGKFHTGLLRGTLRKESDSISRTIYLLTLPAQTDQQGSPVIGPGWSRHQFRCSLSRQLPFALCSVEFSVWELRIDKVQVCGCGRGCGCGCGLL